jgi:hypothetical protein
MNVNEATVFFKNLPADEQAKFLALFSHNLTVSARISYEVGTENITNPRLIREINEIQHRVSMQIYLLLDNNSEPYPDDVLMQIILEHSENKELEAEVMWAFEQVADRFSVAV